MWISNPPSLHLFLFSQGKLVKYFSRQLSCKCKVALEERSTELEDFPRLGHWFRIVNLRKEVTEVDTSSHDCIMLKATHQIICIYNVGMLGEIALIKNMVSDNVWTIDRWSQGLPFMIVKTIIFDLIRLCIIINIM